MLKTGLFCFVTSAWVTIVPPTKRHSSHLGNDRFHRRVMIVTTAKTGPFRISDFREGSDRPSSKRCRLDRGNDRYLRMTIVTSALPSSYATATSPLQATRIGLQGVTIVSNLVTIVTPSGAIFFDSRSYYLTCSSLANSSKVG